MNLKQGNYLSLVTSSGADVSVSASYRDDGSIKTSTPGVLNTAITTATTTTFLEGPTGGAGGSSRVVERISIRNIDVTSNTVTVKLYDGTTNVEIKKVTLAAGGELHYEDGAGWTTPSTAPSGYTLLTTTTDVANAHATPDTLADITGLTIAVTAGDSYRFRFVAGYTSAATTTGARFTINGPAMTSINFVSRWTLTATTEYFFYASALLGGTVQATSLAAGNMVVIEGVCKPSADGTLAVQFSSEITVSAITVLAGATFEVIKTVDA